ncbi:unnamed protein product [Ixodes pacificus]
MPSPRSFRIYRHTCQKRRQNPGRKEKGVKVKQRPAAWKSHRMPDRDLQESPTPSSSGETTQGTAVAAHVGETAQGTVVPADGQHSSAFLFRLKTPSKYWSTHYFPGFDGVLYCTSSLSEDVVVTSEKVVMFVCDRLPDVYFKVYLRGRLVEESRLNSQAEAEDLLEKVETFELCVGALDAKGYDPSFFTKRLQEQVMSRQGTYFNRNCLGRMEEKGEH